MSAAARAAGRDAGPAPARATAVRPSHQEAVLRAGLNPKYTFDQFVVGSSNQFSHAACQAIAERPARAYNPLFLHGGVGLGKTHLLHAVGSEILRRWPDLRVTYISSENFMNELIHSLRTRDTNTFRTRFRDQCDLLLMDDIQFIAGKDSTQEEFFHTFNALYQAHRQIAITSDKSPGELPGLEERLRSRFAWGLIADIQAPDIETRIAIIRKKADEEEIHVSNDVAMYLATHIRSNVRELEGSLVRLKAYAALYGQSINLEMAKAQLRAVIREQTRQVTVERIQRVVANFFNVKVKDLVGRRRHRVIAHPRHIAMYLSRHHTQESFPEIGKHFGGRDHSTVMNAVNKIEKSLISDEGLKQEVRTLEQSLLG
jgi:chromosomal replication initiator protein